MANLVALKFESGIRTVDDLKKGHKKGQAEYPDLNQVSDVARKGLDWSAYLDVYGIGMQYDKTCGHKEHTVESPIGKQCCVIAVEQDFASEALALFPDRFIQLTPAEFESFYNTKAHAHEPDEHVDKDAIEAIEAKERLGLAVPEKIDAINPKSTTRGIRENKEKTWARKKACCGHEII